MRRLVQPALLVFLVASTALAADPFELKDGDRVVFVGGTFIEREGNDGYLEVMLTSMFPDRNITFRNLGWSGDTVWGEARARFGPPSEGFAHLKQHVEALKPTLIFACYGLNESFAGKAGLPAFEAGLNTLLDMFDKTGARVVLITPRKLEAVGPPLPDPARANERLADYVSILRRVAASRKLLVVDLLADLPPDGITPLTDNGIHLTEDGYAALSCAFGWMLGIPQGPVQVKLSATGRLLYDPKDAQAGLWPRIDEIKASPRGLSFRATLAHLPIVIPDAVTVSGLGPGAYELKVDGKPIGPLQVGAGPLDLPLDDGPDLVQARALHAAILAKNELYFHRWRPQNETYLFGFRKHEQGNNAVEIPRFDPLVVAKEAEIAKLRVPVAHTYEIIRKD